MAKLSLEAWTAAFYEVMKETPPVSPKTVKHAGVSLGKQKAETGKAVKGAEDQASMARNLWEDAENKREQAAEKFHEARLASWSKEKHAEAQRAYDEVAERAEAARLSLNEAKGAVKVLKFRSAEIDRQMQELQQRTASGNFDGLQGELEQVLMQARLQTRLELEQQMVDEAQQKVDNLSGLLQEANARRDVREAQSLKGDLAFRLEVLEQRRNQREAVLALMPGYEIAEVRPDQQAKLKEQTESLQRASQVAKDTAAAQRRKVDESQAGVDGAAGRLEQAAGQDPALKAAHDALLLARTGLGECQSGLGDVDDELETLGQTYARHKALIDSYAAGSAQAPTAKEVDGSLMLLEQLAGRLADGKGRLRERQDALRKAGAEVEKQRDALSAAIDERLGKPGADPSLPQAKQALALAEAELRRAAEAQREAEAQALALSVQANEAKRRLQVVLTLPSTTSVAQELTATLKGAEEVPIWESSVALQKKLGKATYERLLQLGHKLINDFQKLVENGATMEELQAVYKGVPELWLPPRFREEEKNWSAMRGLLDEEAEDGFRKETSTRLAEVDKKIKAAKGVLEPGESMFGAIKSGIEFGEKAPEVIKAVAEKLKSTKHMAEKFEEVLGLAGKVATLLSAPMTAIESGSQSMQTEDPVEMLMLQDEFMASLGEMISGLTGSLGGMNKLDIGGVVVKQIATLLPGLGVAVSFADVMKGLVEAAARIEETLSDAEAHEQAVAGKHRGETAVDQFARRDQALAKRASAKTGVAMIKAAAGVIDLTGVGIAVSSAMKGAATGIGLAQKVGEQIVDRNEGDVARALLQRAQAGDGHARSELFRFHPRYAKGILAIMASEGDALALKVLSTHGLSEDMIRRSSPKIVKRYLMKKFGETDTPPSWIGLREAVSEKVATVARLIDGIDGFFGNLADTWIERFDSDTLIVVQASLTKLLYQLGTQADIGGAVSAFVDVRVRRDALAAKATDEQAKDLEALDLALAEKLKKVAKLRSAVLASLGRVRAVLAAIQKHPASAELRPQAEQLARSVLREHLARVDRLASVG